MIVDDAAEVIVRAQAAIADGDIVSVAVMCAEARRQIGLLFAGFGHVTPEMLGEEASA